MKVVGAAIVVALAAAVWILARKPTEKAAPAPSTAPTAPAAKVSLSLVYPRVDLSGVSLFRAELPDERGDLTRWVRAVLAALARPPDPAASPPLPAGTQLNAAFLDERGTLYLDLSAPAVPSGPAGVEWETLAVRAVAQTLAEAVPDAKALKILASPWEHLDLRRPFPIRPLSPR